MLPIAMMIFISWKALNCHSLYVAVTALLRHNLGDDVILSLPACGHRESIKFTAQAVPLMYDIIRQ